MKFKIDENLPVEVADVLKQFGHDAVSVYDEGLSGEIDREIGRVCQKEQRALLTLDLDFADIRAYPPQQYAEGWTSWSGLRVRARQVTFVRNLVPFAEMGSDTTARSGWMRG